MVLVILAGGRGSRYGGEKQFDALGPNNEWLLEYNLYDALLEGFTEVVVVTPPVARDSIASSLRTRLPSSVGLTCVAQSLDDVPFDVPQDRVKPWGTAHAVWCAREVIKSPFLTLNADDLYGRAALRDAAILCRLAETNPAYQGIVTFHLARTLSRHGGVSRGVCEMADGRLTHVTEYQSIRMHDGMLVDQETESTFKEDTLVSMNLWVLQPTILKSIEQALLDSTETWRKNHGELYLPDIVQQEVDAGKVEVWNRLTSSSWAGLTHRDDRIAMKEQLELLIANGTYPNQLNKSVPKDVLDAFDRSAGQIALPLSSGLINETFKVSSEKMNFILQRLNGELFREPEKVMHNIHVVNIALQSGNDYKVPSLIQTVTGKSVFKDETGATWRAMQFIENTETFSSTESLPVAEEAGRVIGRFHRLTAKVPVENLHLTLPNFHQVESRLRQLASAAEHASKEKLDSVIKPMQFFRRHMKRMLKLDRIEVPIRVTHNDTKLNNILFDRESGKALCLVDLDTLMPGKLHHDIADAVRTLCNAVSENESDTSVVKFNIPLFLAFCEGYFEEVDEILTVKEREILPEAMLLLPYLMGVRFLTDHLNDNVYYQTSYPEQNLHRTMNQVALFNDIKKWLPVIREIIQART